MKVSWQARVVGNKLQPIQHVSRFVRSDVKNAEGAQIGKDEVDRHEGVRKQLFQLQAAAGDMQPAECPLQHSFIDGVYVRTIFIPAGTVIVGKIHKHSHANILSKGEVSVMTEDGGLQRLVGPLTMTSPAGCKRAVYAHTDTTWTTIHRTDETDLEKIEEWVIAKTYEDYEQFKLQGETMKLTEVLT